MPLDIKWLDAFKLPKRIQFGISLAALILLICDYYGLFLLNIFGELAYPIVFVIFVVSGTISIVSLIALIYEFCARKLESYNYKKETLKRLDHISAEELDELAKCLIKGTQSFYTYVHSPAVSNLQLKGMISTPGGQHHRDYYPFTINDFVWEEMIRRKEEFLAKDAAFKANIANKQKGR